MDSSSSKGRRRNKNLKCPNCVEKFFSRDKLRNHIEVVHEVKIEMQKEKFNTIKDFLFWKENMEKELNCLFINPNSFRKLASKAKKSNYYCHRSSFKNRRYDSDTIDGSCPSSIDVLETEHEVEITFWKTHCGHTNEDLHNMEEDPAEEETSDFSISTLSVSCPAIECSDCFHFRHELRIHIKEVHNVELEVHEEIFSTFADFEMWKKQYEKQSKCFYIRYTGVQSLQSVNIHRYACYRLGCFKKKNINQRSKKIIGCCPSNIKVIETDGQIRMEFWKTHFGHDFPLIDKEKHEIANFGNSTRTIVCPAIECSDSFCFRRELLIHINDVHNVELEVHEEIFSTFADFEMWKKRFEKQNKCLYVQIRGVDSLKTVNIHRYACHRSGFFKSKSKGKRNLRSQGSRKINGCCPSNIKLIETEHGIHMEFWKTHFGHDFELCYIPRTVEGRHETVCKKKSSLMEAGSETTLAVNTLILFEDDVSVTEVNSSSLPSGQFSNILQVVKSSVLDAEIRWAANCVTSHYSFDSCKEITSLFKIMFPDSEIAQEFTCEPTKCAYLICFGLGPYYSSLLTDVISKCNYFTISYFESLNESLQGKQLDVYIRFWNENTNLVNTRYLTSVFLENSTAVDILESFDKALSKLQLSKMLQLSMDGSAADLKTFHLFQEKINTEFNKEILNLGSCTLHIVNDAFENGCQATEWDIETLLSSLYWLLKDSPATRDDILKISSSQKLPLKFCHHRWSENIPVVERAIEIWEDIKSYVRNVEIGTFSKPKCKYFSIVQKACEDKLIVIRLNVFLSVAKIIYPFLILYQSEKPLLPFIAEDLRKLISNLIFNFNLLKKSEHDILTTPMKISTLDLRDKAKLSCISQISVSFAGDRILQTLKIKGEVSDKDIYDLKLECQTFIITLISNLLEKSPIKNSFVRCLAALDPRLMAQRNGNCYSKMTYLLTQLIDANLIPETDCEEILLEYSTFLFLILKNKLKKKFQSFDPSDENVRVDTFLKKFCDEKETSKLWEVIKMLLILSHGQAEVKIGFSFIQQIEVETFKEEALIAQRIILDHFKYEDLDINNELRGYAILARQKYVQYLENQKNVKKISLKKRKSLGKLNNIKSKKARIEQAIEDLENNADKLAEKAEICGELNLISQSNSFRKSAKEKRCELEKLDKEIINLTKELNEH